MQEQYISLAIQLDQRGVIGVQVFANTGIHAGQAAARFLDLFAFAGHAIHIGGGPAQIGNVAGEFGDFVSDFFDLFQDRFVRTALDDAAFVLGDRAEGAAAETTAHDVDREANHLPGREIRLAVTGVGRAGEGRAALRVIYKS